MHIQQLMSFPFFKALDAEILLQLAENSCLRHYKKGELLFLHGDAIEYLYFISVGWVHLFRDTFDGQEAMLGLATNNDLIGTIDIDKKHHSFSAKVINETELLLIPYDLFITSVKNNDLLSLKIIKTLNSAVSLLELQLEHASTMNAAQRIGCFFLRLCGEKKTDIEITLPYDKGLIAAYLGMKRETFSRALHDLTSHGVTVKGHTLLIKNIQALINFSCISCSLVYDSCKEC